LSSDVGIAVHQHVGQRGLHGAADLHNRNTTSCCPLPAILRETVDRSCSNSPQAPPRLRAVRESAGCRPRSLCRAVGGRLRQTATISRKPLSSSMPITRDVTGQRI
jgi:hypothetical protein